MRKRLNLSILGLIILFLISQKAYTQNLPNIDVIIKGVRTPPAFWPTDLAQKSL